MRLLSSIPEENEGGQLLIYTNRCKTSSSFLQAALLYLCMQLPLPSALHSQALQRQRELTATFHCEPAACSSAENSKP